MTSSITKYFSPGIPMSERDMKPSSSHRAMVWRLTPAIFASTLWPIISLPRMAGYLYLRVAWLNLMRSMTASTLFMVGRTRSCTRITASVLPALRKIAKETAKSNYSEYLNEAGTMLGEASYHEEFMVWGLVIAYIKADRSEVERHLDEFVPKINNWAVCDSCVTSYKFMQKESDFWFDYVKKYAESKNEFELRFMIVSLMSHFLDKEHIDEILTICGKIDHDGYYVKMGNAWALSVCYVKFPEKTRAFLEKDTLDDFTHNKAIQKIRESYRVSKEEKEQLTCLKR